MNLEDNVKDLIREAESNAGLDIPEEDVDEEVIYMLDDHGNVIGMVEKK